MITFIVIIYNSLQLDKNHQYYHQVQLQLYVASEKAKWCDFCVDDAWQVHVCTQLDEYFFEHILSTVAQM